MSILSERPNVTQEEINAFKMPPIAQGKPVAFYPQGLRNSQKPSVGFVVSCFDRTVTVSIPETSQKHAAVRHIDDPKLRLNAAQRENGAWDFCDADKQEAAERQEFLSRLQKLERTVTALTVGHAKTGEVQEKGASINDLRSEAKSLGIEVERNWGKADLEAAIALHKEEQNQGE